MLTLDLETFTLFGKVIYLNRNTSNRKLKCGSLQSLVEPGPFSLDMSISPLKMFLIKIHKECHRLLPK